MANDFVLSRQMYKEAYQKGMTLSAFLETLDPTEKLSQADRRAMGRDAFVRQMRKLDIRDRTIPEMGVMAHRWERFWDDEDGKSEERKALAPEWLARQFRHAFPVYPRGVANARGLDLHRREITTHNPLSDVLWPDAMDAAMRYQELEPSVLSYVVGRTRGIDSDTFKAFYLTDSTVEAAARMKRVGEYAEIPHMTITGSDQSINVQKYGRALRASYEVMRRQSLDLIAWTVNYIKAKADNDKFLHAVDVLINGDGNSGTSATSTNGSTLDAAAGSTLTLKMYLGWGMLWTRPHQCNVVLGTNGSIISLMLLNAGSANLPPNQAISASGAIGQVTLVKPIYGGVAAINESTVTASNLLGLDNRYTLELVNEVGADIVEVDRIIQRQYEEVVLTESVGFDVMTLGQNRLLAYTA